MRDEGLPYRTRLHDWANDLGDASQPRVTLELIEPTPHPLIHAGPNLDHEKIEWYFEMLALTYQKDEVRVIRSAVSTGP